MNKKIIYKFLIFISLYQTTLPMEDNNNRRLIDATEIDNSQNNNNTKSEPYIKIIAYKRDETGKVIRGRVQINQE